MYFSGGLFIDPALANSNGNRTVISVAEWSFTYAVSKINADKSILPGTKLVADIRYVSAIDTFHANKMVCDLLLNGAKAIFGPPVGAADINSARRLATHIKSITNALDIPYLEASNDCGENGSGTHTINLHPDAELVNEAFSDVIRFLNWTDVAIVFEKTSQNAASINDGCGLIHQFQFSSHLPKLNVYIRYANRNNYASVLRDIKHREYKNIIIDTRPDHISDFLKGVS